MGTLARRASVDAWKRWTRNKIETFPLLESDSERVSYEDTTDALDLPVRYAQACRIAESRWQEQEQRTSRWNQRRLDAAKRRADRVPSPPKETRHLSEIVPEALRPAFLRTLTIGEHFVATRLFRGFTLERIADEAGYTLQAAVVMRSAVRRHGRNFVSGAGSQPRSAT